jgi:hypothetical protein|tara:strand:- start:5460 stop:5822 length:363 start_codon:yes stop_codon:yes gene_type:complete
MAVISGKNGTVNFGGAQSDATGWSLALTSNNPAYGSSDTSGYKKRVGGIKDWSGSYSAKLDGTSVPVAGASVAVSFSTDGTNTWSGTAVCDSVNIEVDMDDGDVVGYSVDFSGNSVVTGA